MFRYFGFENFDEWVEGDLASVADLQVAVAVAASWTYRKFILPFFQYPHRLAGDGDHRNSDQDSMAIVDTFLAKAPCCLRPGFARRLRSVSPSAETLCGPAWQQAMRAWARQIRFGIASIEWRHAWNSVHSTPSTAWHNMAASYTTREASYLLRARNLRAAQAALSAPQLALDDAPADAPMGNPADSAGDERKLYKAQSPLELHRKEFMNRRRLMGESTAWSAELWPLIRRSFNELPPVHQARLQDESKLTASIGIGDRGGSWCSSRSSQQRSQ